MIEVGDALNLEAMEFSDSYEEVGGDVPIERLETSTLLHA